MILDESTNALDEQNEKRIMNEIKRLSSEKTFITVSIKIQSLIFVIKF